MASEWDVIAVGAGLAGLTATNRALELGRRALVLERSTEPRHTCASRANGGVFHVGFRSVMTDPNELFRVVNAATGNFPDPLVARALADNALRSIEWLKSFGTKFVPLEPTDGWKEHTLHPLGFHNKTTMEWQDLGADRLITRLEQRVKELGGDSLRGARVTGLIIENGNVRGVTARTADGEDRTAPAPWSSRTAVSRVIRRCSDATLPPISSICTCGLLNPATATACEWPRRLAAC